MEGFGDGSAQAGAAEPIRVLDGAADEAASVLDGEPIVERMERVLAPISGFESAYGLELLATVHWVGTRGGVGDDLHAVTKKVQKWSRRKQRMFTDMHIEIAWNRLQAEGWLTPNPVAREESAA